MPFSFPLYTVFISHTRLFHSLYTPFSFPLYAFFIPSICLFHSLYMPFSFPLYAFFCSLIGLDENIRGQAVTKFNTWKQILICLFLDDKHVLEQARALDKVPAEKRGPLHGVAIGIKDVMETKDMPTQYQSPLYKGFQSGGDAAIVAVLRAAGALIFGKTTTTEFTVTNAGPNTTNPHDPNRTPGGSSCGSAAAVADLQVPIALGAQTGGSLIRPASFTGVFAMKPTHNAVSAEGSKVFSPTFDTLGFFSRSVEDLKLIADALAIKDDTTPPPQPSLEKTTVALVRTPLWSRAGPGTVAAMEKAAKILQSHGVKVEEVSLPEEIGNDAASLKRIHKVVMASEAGVVFLKEYEMNKTELASEIRQMVENCGNYTHAERLKAADKLASMRPVIDRLASDYSVILAPSVVDEAPVGLNDMGSAAFNTIWTGFHTPVINIPAFAGAHDMPIGISLVAGRFRDQHLLSISALLSRPLMAEGGWKMDKMEAKI
ncbi:amidase signature domain-containing protein [Rhypophila decipiens]|uniref:Amidase signature domain-containing protein n=1 Tax=Rhypophila decipiens TaxID=261697 RepID=A0AAN6YIF8_9PEZI|nr:amidase signature domain-containing protein [Rhypophila decipiens]